MAITKDLIAASSTPLVLSILKQGDSSGCEIIHKVCEPSDGALEWADGMLYPHPASAREEGARRVVLGSG